MKRFIWRGERVPVRACRARAVEARCLISGFGGTRGNHLVARTLSGHQNDLGPAHISIGHVQLRAATIQYLIV